MYFNGTFVDLDLVPDCGMYVLCIFVISMLP